MPDREASPPSPDIHNLPTATTRSYCDSSDDEIQHILSTFYLHDSSDDEYNEAELKEGKQGYISTNSERQVYTHSAHRLPFEPARLVAPQHLV